MFFQPSQNSFCVSLFTVVDKQATLHLRGDLLMSDKELWINIGKTVSHYRKSKKLTQIKLAELAHCSNNHISALENGASRVSLKLLCSICHALDLTLDRVISQSTSSNRIPSDIIEDLNTFTDIQFECLRRFIPVIQKLPLGIKESDD